VWREGRGEGIMGARRKGNERPGRGLDNGEARKKGEGHGGESERGRLKGKGDDGPSFRGFVACW